MPTGLIDGGDTILYAIGLPSLCVMFCDWNADRLDLLQCSWIMWDKRDSGARGTDPVKQCCHWQLVRVGDWLDGVERGMWSLMRWPFRELSSENRSPHEPHRHMTVKNLSLMLLSSVLGDSNWDSMHDWLEADNGLTVDDDILSTTHLLCFACNCKMALAFGLRTDIMFSCAFVTRRWIRLRYQYTRFLVRLGRLGCPRFMQSSLGFLDDCK